MPYMVVNIWYPAHKIDEVVKIGFEVVQKYPPDKDLGERILPLATNNSERGVEGMTIWEIKEGKLEEALRRAGEAYAMFRGIEGFKHTIIVWSTAAEAYATIGKKSPI